MRFALCRAVPPPRARQQHGRAPASHRLSTDPRPPAARTANSPPAVSAGRVSADRRSLAVTPEIVEAPPAATAVIDRLGRCRSGLTRRLRGRGAGASDQRVSRTTLLRFGRGQFWIVRRASIRSASIRSASIRYRLPRNNDREAHRKAHVQPRRDRSWVGRKPDFAPSASWCRPRQAASRNTRQEPASCGGAAVRVPK